MKIYLSLFLALVTGAVSASSVGGGGGTTLNTKGDIHTTDGTSNAALGVGTNNQCLVADSVQTYGIKWGSCASGTSPLTTKGDVFTFNAAADERLGVGSNGQCLQANSGETTGLIWGTCYTPTFTASSSDTLTNKTLDCNGTGNSCANIDLTADVTDATPIANGGTGQTAKTAAFDALSPVTTAGDLIVRGASANVRLAVGTNSFVPVADSATAAGISWRSPAEGLVEEISGHIETLADKSYILIQSAKYARYVNNITNQCYSGSATGALQIEGTPVTGCTSSEVAFSLTESTDTCSAGNLVAAGETLLLNVTSNSSGTDCKFSVKTTRQ